MFRLPDGRLAMRITKAATAAAMRGADSRMTAPAPTGKVTITPYSDFAEGDLVSRGDDGIHLVRQMSDDGFHATFICVVAPSRGWCEVGNVEQNLCRRYGRIDDLEVEVVDSRYRWRKPTANQE